MPVRLPKEWQKKLGHFALGQRVGRDPRFDNLCGTFQPRFFKTAYRFLEEKKRNELDEIKELHRRVRDTDKKLQLRSLIDHYKDSLSKSHKEDHQMNLMQNWKSQEKTRVGGGKKPFFLKNSAIKELSMMDKYESLRQSGRLQSFLTKKKEKNWLPKNIGGCPTPLSTPKSIDPSDRLARILMKS